MTVIRSGDDSPLDPSALSTAIDRLPEAEKVVMTLADYKGLSDDMATLTESEATVTALHESALQRLAEAVGAPPRVVDAVIEPTYLPFTESDLSRPVPSSR